MLTMPTDSGSRDVYRSDRLNDVLAGLPREQRDSLLKRLGLDEMLKKEPGTYFEHINKANGPDEFIIRRDGSQESSGRFQIWKTDDGQLHFDGFRVHEHEVKADHGADAGGALFSGAEK